MSETVFDLVESELLDWEDETGIRWNDVIAFSKLNRSVIAAAQEFAGWDDETHAVNAVMDGFHDDVIRAYSAPMHCKGQIALRGVKAA